MNTRHGIAILISALGALTTGCFDSEEPKKVELVDSTKKNDGSIDPNAIAESDFTALQDEVKALKDQLAALQSSSASQTNAINSALAVQAGDLADVIQSLNSITNSSAKQLWLYDGNGEKKHRVVTIKDHSGTLEALVEKSQGILMRYRINRPANTTLQQTPETLQTTGGIELAVRYNQTACVGEGVVMDSDSGADFGQAGAVGNYLFWVEQDAISYPSFSQASGYVGGTCTNSSASIGTRVRVVSSAPLANFSYPNPLTVGP